MVLLMAMFLFLFGMHALQVSAASAASANYIASAEKVSGGSWQKDELGRSYKKADGSSVADKWCKIGKYFYRFNTQGYCETGIFQYDGKKYYASSAGRITIKKWKKLQKKWYYFKSNGQMARSSMFKQGKNYYYTDENGVRVTSAWVTIKNKKYYFNSKGVRLQKKWLKKGGKYYYFHSDGVLAVNEWVGEYYAGADGARMVSCVIDGYVLDKNGKKTEDVSAIKDVDYIFLGDSRMEGMRLSVSTKSVAFIAKVGMGYSWLDSTAGVKLDALLKIRDDITVILALGVNDLGNIASYIKYYNALIKKYPKTKFRMLAVNPVDETRERVYGYSVTNKQIKDFNDKMQAAFPELFLDSYTYLKEKGFSTADGVHYQGETYKKIYDYIISVAKP